MSVNYTSVGWNRQKKIYDWMMLALIGLYLLVFVLFNLIFHPEITAETLIIRATASLALIMLHVILLIGPLCRIDRRFLPLLYNRRHLGVSMFLIALIHAIFSLIQFHALGNTDPLSSLFLSNIQYSSLEAFPFQTLGFFALIILFLMAASSHDFWMHNLSPRIWKGLHMMVYFAYGLILMHIMLGVIQLEKSPVLIGLLGLGMLAVIGFHLWAGIKEQYSESVLTVSEGFVEVCALSDIPEDRAKIVVADGQSIAVFRYDGKLSAIHNACKHQNGPLGEGKVIDGCVTCPWHGYQYRPADGASPPPFTEKVATYDVQIKNGKVWLNPKPYPEGTHREPAII